MNFFEQELRKLFDNDIFDDAKFIGRACYYQVNENTTAKIEFVTQGTYEKYEGIRTTLINKNDGQIDSNTILFGDLLGVRQTQHLKTVPHIWCYNGKYEWYAYQPTDSDYFGISSTIDEYLDIFREEPIQEMGGQSM